MILSVCFQETLLIAGVWKLLSLAACFACRQKCVFLEGLGCNSNLEPDASGTLLRQTAIFDPLGLLGRLYWYLLYPLHQVLFQGMLRGIVTATGEAQ